MMTKINGVTYNTREKQQANFKNIQVKGNALWGEPIIQKVEPIKEEEDNTQLFPINGAIYNTKEKQQANFDKIIVKDNGLWGIPKIQKIEPAAPIAPPQEKIISDPNYKIDPNKEINPVDFTNDIAEEKHKEQSNEPYFNKNLKGTGIQLVGANIQDWQKEIVDKYSLMFKAPIMVKMIPDLGKTKDGRKIAGITAFMKDGTREVELDEKISERDFKRAILHEIGHQVFNYSEQGADDYAARMLEILDNLK